MTRRERVLSALRRQPPDRVPVDIGGTLASTLHVHVYRRLMAHLGLDMDPAIAYVSRRSNAVLPAERLLQRLDVDCRGVILGNPDAAPERELPDGSLHDEWGVTWRRVGEGQHFINAEGPFSRHEPDPALVEKFAWPDPLDAGRFRTLRSQAEAHRAASDAAVILVFGVGPVHQLQFMRGYAAALEDMVTAPRFIQAFLERYVDFWARMARRALGEAGDLVDLVMFGDDLGTQQGPVMRPALYRTLIKPAHAAMARAVKETGKPILFHTCGSVAPFMPDFIEIGLDAVHPVQVSARDMDPGRLQAEFGRELAFWGGIDTQRLLPLATPAEVREDVRRRVQDLGARGGYVLGAVHNIQPEVPVENILAMLDAARQHGWYRRMDPQAGRETSRRDDGGAAE
jgi:uroporphyrinogen decarboxylase